MGGIGEGKYAHFALHGGGLILDVIPINPTLLLYQYDSV